jgi:hypothetical protein
MDTEKSCPNCRAAMKLESKTPRFLSFECPKCAFVLIEVAKEDAPPRIHSVVHGGHLHNDYLLCGGRRRTGRQEVVMAGAGDDVILGRQRQTEAHLLREFPSCVY